MSNRYAWINEVLDDIDHAAPAERTSSGEAGDVKPGAAPINPAPIAAVKTEPTTRGRDAAGVEQ